MAHDPLIAVGDVLREIDFLQSMAANSTFERFSADGTAIRAAAYSIQIISEAVRHIPDDWLADFPTEPWTAIKATGNKIRHEYFRIDDAILWDIATTHCLSLRSVMHKLQTKHGAP